VTRGTKKGAHGDGGDFFQIALCCMKISLFRFQLKKKVLEKVLCSTRQLQKTAGSKSKEKYVKNKF